MKLVLLTFLFALSSYASLSEEGCDAPGSTIIPADTSAQISKIKDALKSEFMRRPMPKNFNLALAVETNFTAPIVGKENYWGRIYLKDSDDDHVVYRDELIAERYYREESKDPKHAPYLATYSIQDINSASGLSLVKAAGAEVNVQSVGGNFSGKTGGRISIRVKAPGGKQNNLMVDVVRSTGQIKKFFIQGNTRIPFDSIRINASRNFLGVTSILNGIEDIQFISSGKTVVTIKQ